MTTRNGAWGEPREALQPRNDYYSSYCLVDNPFVKAGAPVSARPEELPKLTKGHICNYRFGELGAQTNWKYLLTFCKSQGTCAPGVRLKRDKHRREYCKSGARSGFRRLGNSSASKGW